MESITISRVDGVVYKNGEARKVDLSALPKEIAVIQWFHCPKREKSKGQVDYVQDPLEDPRPPEEIHSFEPYQKFVTAWEKAPTMAQLAEIEMAKADVDQLETMLTQAKDRLGKAKKAVDGA